MKILILNASPRKNGNTNEVCNIITKKLSNMENVEIENIFLSDINILPCKGCCNCLTVGETFCPQKNDERQMLEEKILSSDGIIFASPVYAMNMTAGMKNFMDRFAFTMHRPRFFNQYTMIVCVTGAFGLDETIKSMSQMKYSGFNIVETLGIKAQNPLVNIGFTDKKIIDKIENKTEHFYKIINKKKPIKPTLINLLSFIFQGKYFSRLDSEKSADWKYFNEKGWFDPECKYYIPSAKISPINRVISTILAKFAK